MSAEHPQYPQNPHYPPSAHMTAQHPQYPPMAQAYPEQPQGAPVAPPPYPGTSGSYPGYPGYPGYSGYSAYPGYPAAPYYAGPMPRKTNGLAIASLSCSIASFIIIPVIGAVLGVIFGHLALGQLRRAEGAEEGRGLAIAGLAVGYVNLILWLLAGLVFVIVLLVVTAQPGSTSLLW